MPASKTPAAKTQADVAAKMPKSRAKGKEAKAKAKAKAKPAKAAAEPPAAEAPAAEAPAAEAPAAEAPAAEAPAAEPTVPVDGAAPKAKRRRTKKEFDIQRAVMERLVKEIIQSVSAEDGTRISNSAVLAIQTAAEKFLVDLFQDASLIAQVADVKTVGTNEFRVAHYLTTR
jgi:histone H3/H4